MMRMLLIKWEIATTFVQNPYTINNDYLETRSHEILTNDEIETRLVEFENKFGKNGIGCDLRFWEV